MVEWVRRLRMVSQAISGRPRFTVRSYYEGLPSVAGRGADERKRKPAGSGSHKLPSAPGRTVPKPKIAAVERRKACASVCRPLTMQGSHAACATSVATLVAQCGYLSKMRRSALRSPGRGLGGVVPR